MPLPVALKFLTMHAVPMHVLLLDALPEPPYWKVMLVIGTSMMISAPSMLEERMVAFVPAPPVSMALGFRTSVSLSLDQGLMSSRYPIWVINIIRIQSVIAADESLSLISRMEVLIEFVK